ncbi:MAG: NAD(P)/FAD-dependent oxidoreductase [Methanomassiliicoccales archaeon]|jgi:digeranylgeranylglycerophospholipid reductase
MDEYHTVIVGAGPAGSSVASTLQPRLAKDQRVLLLERLPQDKFDRYHRMCGEGISHAGLKEAGCLDRKFIVDIITRAEEHWPGDITIETRLKGYIIDRTLVLKELRKRFEDHGGIVSRETVISIRRSGHGFVLGTMSGDEVKCKYLVGADGAQSLVRKEMFPDQEITKIWAVQAVLDVKPEKGIIHFHYDHRYGGGYRWEFPNGNMSRIGFPRGTDVLPDNAVEVHERAVPIGSLDSLVSGNACIVGDAAAMVNPVSFGGIRTALVSGRMVADAIAKMNLGQYEISWKRSGFANPIFMASYRALASMSNDDMTRSIRPYKGGLTAFNHAKAILKYPEYRVLYRSYGLSLRYGW